MTTRIRRPTTDTAPDLLTLEEAARVLRVGRTTAYADVRRWFATGGADGLPAVRVRRQVRVPRRELEDRIGGPITWPIPDEPAAATTTAAPVTAIDTRPRPSRRRRSRSAQPTLPLPS
jgi:excisionase family DNA binding protein